MNRPILLFSRATPHHHTGGMETLAWNLAAEWNRAGHTVRIITTTVPGHEGPFVEHGVEVVPLAGTRPGVYSRAWWRATRVYWASLGTTPTAVLSVSAGAFSMLSKRSRHPRTPFVMQAHGTSAMEILSKVRALRPRSVATAPRNAIGLVRDLAHYRDFDRIVAVGQPVVDSLLARPQSWVVDPEKVCLIPNGVRVDHYGFDPVARRDIRRALGVGDEVGVVACVGRLHMQKRLDRALLAAAALRSRGQANAFRFLLVGDGPDEARLRQIVMDLRLTDIVHFVGRIGWNRVRDYYSAADVALLTTGRREGAPLAVPEALACGLPCVVPAGLGEGLGESVYEVDAADPGHVADALCAATRSRGSRTSRLPDRLTIEHCATSYLTLFDDLVEGHRDPMCDG